MAEVVGEQREMDMRVVSFRQPYGFCIINKCKLIENRKKPVPPSLIESWHALHISKAYGVTEKETTLSMLYSSACASLVNDYEAKANDDDDPFVQRIEKIKELKAIMDKQRGKIVGFFKVDRNCGFDEAILVDRFNTDYPEETQCKWIIGDVIKIDESDYIDWSGNTSWLRLKKRKTEIMEVFDKYFETDKK